MVSSLYSDRENVVISHKRYGNRVFFVAADITVFIVFGLLVSPQRPPGWMHGSMAMCWSIDNSLSSS